MTAHTPMMMPSMVSSVRPESDESSSSTSYVNMFKDTLIQEYASLSSESNGGEGLGIAQLLYEQMKRNYSND